MNKFNHLDEMPIAELSHEQLSILQTAEENINREQNSSEVYLIAFRRPKE